MRGNSLLDLKDSETTDDKSGRLCAFPAVLDVVLFNREERLVLQTSAVGIPLPTIKWYQQYSTTESDESDEKSTNLKGTLRVPKRVIIHVFVI